MGEIGFTRIVIATAITDALGSVALEFPRVDKAKKRELAAAREAQPRVGARRVDQTPPRMHWS